MAGGRVPTPRLLRESDPPQDRSPDLAGVQGRWQACGGFRTARRRCDHRRWSTRPGATHRAGVHRWHRSEAQGSGNASQGLQVPLGVLGVLEASGTTVHDLATEVGPVEGVTCEEDRVRFVTSLRQLPHRRCAEGRCRDVPGGEVRGVEVTVSQDPWRVVSLESSG